MWILWELGLVWSIDKSFYCQKDVGFRLQAAAKYMYNDITQV